MKWNVVVVRYGEIALKGPIVRERMENTLMRNILWRARRSGIAIKKIGIRNARVIVYPDNVERCRDLAIEITKVFGVVSTSPALETSNDIETVSKIAIEIAREKMSENAKSFAIRARRVESYPLTSKDIERIVGQRVKEALGLRVDLEQPDIEIHIEMRSDRAYIYTDVLRGPGGLPYGVEGLCVSLFSGGMDSTLASWLMAKRGCRIRLLHMRLYPLYGEDAFERAITVAKQLREWFPEDDYAMAIVDNYGELLKELITVVPERIRCIVCKRLMLEIAQRYANEIGAKAIITGESIGQVASQTLDNVYAIHTGIEIPILTPVIAMDKEEIAQKLREIGLYTYVARSVTACKVTPRYPETHADIHIVRKYLDKVRNITKKAVIKELKLD